MEPEPDLAQGMDPASARVDYLGLHDNLAAENARLRQDAERLARRLAGRYEETVGLRAQIEWMRPVVEAAEALVNFRDARLLKRSDPDWWSGGDFRLVSAVDAYRAGQKGSLDRSESTGLSYAPLATADPPGLDAAIEAAAEDVATRYSGGRRDDTMSVTFTASDGYTSVRFATVAEVIPFAVRAAAPALRAAALREAADEMAAELPYSPIRWLRERADREVAR